MLTNTVGQAIRIALWGGPVGCGGLAGRRVGQRQKVGKRPARPPQPERLPHMANVLC